MTDAQHGKESSKEVIGLSLEAGGTPAEVIQALTVAATQVLDWGRDPVRSKRDFVLKQNGPVDSEQFLSLVLHAAK